MLVTMLGIAVLAVLAVIGRSAVMFVSAVAIGLIVYVFRRARTRDKVIAIIVAGLGGSIGAEIVHTFYHYATVIEPVVGNGGFFMSAMTIGLINAAAIVIALLCTDAWLKYIGRKSE